MINDGLWCSFEDWHMGNAGEVVAERLWHHAKRPGRDTRWTVTARRPRPRPQADSTPRSCRSTFLRRRAIRSSFDRDESVRAETTMDALGALKPAFKDDGTVTAGNAPPVNDGAAALVVMSDRARA